MVLFFRCFNTHSETLEGHSTMSDVFITGTAASLHEMPVKSAKNTHSFEGLQTTKIFLILIIKKLANWRRADGNFLLTFQIALFSSLLNMFTDDLDEKQKDAH